MRNNFALTLCFVIFILSLSACGSDQPIAPTMQPTVILLTATTRPTQTLSPTDTSTPTVEPTATPLPSNTPTVTTEPTFTPREGDPYQDWAWPNADITVWVADLALNVCDSGTVWYCDPAWNPRMYQNDRIAPPDLRVYNEAWSFAGRAAVEGNDVVTLVFNFPILARDVVINFREGPYLIDLFSGILPSGEKVPMGYALHNGALRPTFLFMDTFMLSDAQWFMEAEQSGQSPAINPCGMVALVDENYTRTGEETTILFRMLDRPTQQLNYMTMGTNAYQLTGIEMVVRRAMGTVVYHTCTNR